MAQDSLESLENILNHRFSDRALLARALTHTSTGQRYNYERLEFLGDRVLGLIVAEMLFKTFPQEKEGDLAKRLAALVQGPMLARVAITIDLGAYMTLSDGERLSGGADNENLLADVMEALIGALYIDAGLDPCRALITRLWEGHLTTMKAPPQHPKTKLQEWAQKNGLALPVYKISGQKGPDHAPVFEVSLYVEGYDVIVAKGKSRQLGEKTAAELFFAKIKAPPDS